MGEWTCDSPGVLGQSQQDRLYLLHSSTYTTTHFPLTQVMLQQIILIAALCSFGSCIDTNVLDWDHFWQSHYDPHYMQRMNDKHNTQTTISPSSVDALTPAQRSGLKACNATQDCIAFDFAYSCLGASIVKEGICLPTLKPMETGCVVDEQCKMACPTSFCRTNEKGQGQCRCQQDRFYLFKKCWKKCLHDISTEGTLDDGTKVCIPKQPEAVIQRYLKRRKRQILGYGNQRARIIC